jgi:serine phosphatase RsbU (regulator of sigma subunit)
MKMRTKIVIGLALALLSFGAFAYLVIAHMSQISDRFDELTDSVIPSLDVYNDLTLALGQLRSAEATHVLQHDPTQMARLSEEIAGLRARLRERVGLYRQLLTVPDQQARVDQFADRLNAYFEGGIPMLELSSQNRNDEAFTLLVQSGPALADLNTRLSELDRLTEATGEAARAAADRVLRSTRLTAMLAIAAAGCGMLALIVLLHRGLVRPITQLTRAIDRVAAGDHESAVPMIVRADELGDVARALDHFRENLREKERLQQQELADLELARRLQLASVPRRFPPYPDRPEFDVFGRLVPTRAVGGDFYDFYFVKPRRIALSIGDASGKGVGSAMFAGSARGALKSERGRGEDPARCLVEANRRIAADNETMMFMTTFYGVLDLATGELTYSNAGHTPPMIVKAGGHVELLATEPALPLGVVEDYAYAVQRCTLAPADAIVLYTDGITEAEAASGELFGQARLIDLLSRCADLRPDALVERMFAAVGQFAVGAPQSDDIAVLVLRYNAPGGIRLGSNHEASKA